MGESNLPDDITENAEFADALRPVGLHPRPHHVVRDDRRGYLVHQNVGTPLLRVLLTAHLY